MVFPQVERLDGGKESVQGALRAFLLLQLRCGSLCRERESKRERKGREVNQKSVSGLLPYTGVGDKGVGESAKRERERAKKNEKKKTQALVTKEAFQSQTFTQASGLQEPQERLHGLLMRC